MWFFKSSCCSFFGCSSFLWYSFTKSFLNFYIIFCFLFKNRYSFFYKKNTYTFSFFSLKTPLSDQKNHSLSLLVETKVTLVLVNVLVLTMLLCSYCCFTVSRSDCDFFFLISVYCTVPHEGQTLTETGLRNLSSNTWTPLTNTTRLDSIRPLRLLWAVWLQSGMNNLSLNIDRQADGRTSTYRQTDWNAKKTYDLSLSWTVLHKITHTHSVSYEPVLHTT